MYPILFQGFFFNATLLLWFVDVCLFKMMNSGGAIEVELFFAAEHCAVPDHIKTIEAGGRKHWQRAAQKQVVW
jgi:hypothetical protein